MEPPLSVSLMGETRAGSGPVRAARHRRARTPLLERREHRRARRRDRAFPAPTPSALVGIAVLVLVGFGVIHLSSTGSAVHLEGTDTAVVQEPSESVTGPEAQEQEEADGAEEADGTGEAEGDDQTGAAAGSDETAAAGQTEDELIVHVSGAVAAPGVVRLPPGSRVDDALQAADGPTGEAELASVNLARPVVDGEQVHVPVPGEEPQLPTGPPPEGEAATPGDEDGSGGASAIDLNDATAAELEELPGVGPAIAQRIIEHREKNGPFRSVDDLVEVSGIGPATLENIREQATVAS